METREGPKYLLVVKPRAVFFFAVLTMFVLYLEDAQERMNIYTNMAQKFPRAQCPKRLPLNFLTGL